MDHLTGRIARSERVPPQGDTSMKIATRPADERGKTRFHWLDSRHTFSFGDYYDPEHMSFRALRVINDDWIEPDQGFGQHPHRDAEILSYVLEGRLQHRDSMGNGSVIEAGDLQYMSAGNGVTHSEFNPSRDERTHLLQIWILPDRSGGARAMPRRHWARRRSRTRSRCCSRAGRATARSGSAQTRTCTSA